MRLAPVLLLVVLVVAGCGGGGGGGATTRTASGDGVLVQYERRGGTGGPDLAVEVQSDGHGVRTSADPRVPSGPIAFTTAQLAALRAALAATDLGHLRSSMAPVPAGGHEYLLTSEGHTVRLVQGQLPPGVTRLIALLEGRARAA
jgi:hypothetical protein